ncbi:MAG: protein kinase, partial [Chloroflexi bacterium]|nr:protein kinase [Chloroflexota bacterium]
MKIKIWGARGSIPAPLTSQGVREKIVAALEGAGGVDLHDPLAVRTYVDSLPSLLRGTAGGNTSCVQVVAGEEIVIIDAGSGIRELGLELMKGPCGRGQGVIHLFFSHTHWDHIQGLPFFLPAYIRGNRLNIYSVHTTVPATLAEQMKPTTFPVPLEYMQSTIQFVSLAESQSLTLGNLHLTSMELPHPGRAYAFRFEHQGAVFVFASDAEYKYLDETSLHPYLHFYAGADALIFDAQYTLREAFVKEDWGHSSALIGADLALRAGVKRLVLFHHDPTSSDADLELMVYQSSAYIAEQESDTPLEVVLAREGLEINLSPTSACSLRTLPNNQVAILRLVGDLDERVVVDLQKQLEQLTAETAPDRPSLIVDLEATTRLSIAGLRALIDIRRQWGSEGVVLAGLSAHVERVISLAEYLDFFAIYPTLQAALAALEARQTLRLPGQLLKGRYRIEARLAESEVGTVLKATDSRLNRPVAIKVLSASFSQAASERFMAEAQRMARLNAPNVATVYDCDVEQGLFYLVTEFVPGKTLRQVMAQNEALPAVDIALEILRALEYAHSKGIVHGNLKPENVLIAGEVKLTDFGLRWIEQGRRLAEAPMLIGSPDYLAPEQILGQPVEPRTDLYAFGVILYELFTGQRPFNGEQTLQVLEEHLHQPPVAPRQLNPDISRSLEHLILKLLAKDPGQRYATAGQVRRVLLSLQHSSTPAASQEEAEWEIET